MVRSGVMGLEWSESEWMMERNEVEWNGME